MVTKLKQYNPSANDLVNDWQVVDASGQVLGRLATQIATLLMGKHKPNYVPHMMSGDFVVVINAEQIKVTGLKAEKKIYKRHSQYPGNLKEISYEVMHDRHPERVIELAVKGMLPKSKLGRQMLKRLKVYAGAEHPHSAQVLGSERREAREAAAAAKAEAEAAKAEVTKPAAKKAAPKAKAEAKAETAPAAEAAVATEEKPAAKKPAAKKPAAKKATAKKAPAKKAAAKKPAAKKPAAKKTTAKKSDDSGEK
jgi:large subunit ribosomal protein L13